MLPCIVQIDARVGPGREGLQQLLQERGTDTFDFAFIDADKGGYQAYFELCLQLVRPGGCIAVDNVLFYGRVVDPTRNDKATGAIRNFNASLATDPRVDFSVVPIGDGVALCRKL
jgi:predicted O-methyltransferase YrrM